MCLLMMCKILMAQIKKIYYSLLSRKTFPRNRKDATRGTEELLYIAQHIVNESKMRRKNLAMAWIDYKKTYDMIPQSWILHCLKMYKIRLSHIVYWEDHGNLKNGTDSKRKKISRGKDPKRHILGRCTITITICNSHDATQPHALEMHSRIQTQ